MKHTASRYHDISCGHRVHGHESKCAHLHGHNYRVHFTVCAGVDEMPLDSIGRVLDFSVIKSRLCMWLEHAWDHKFLVWEADPIASVLLDIDYEGTVKVPFNPTAENMAEYLLRFIGPAMLADTGCTLTSVRIEETAKCSAEVTI